jgi:hypothetical protein
MERRAIDNLSRKFRAAKAAQSLDLERVQGMEHGWVLGTTDGRQPAAAARMIRAASVGELLRHADLDGPIMDAYGSSVN